MAVFALVAASLCGCASTDARRAVAPSERIFGINFSAIAPGQKPGDKISPKQIRERLSIVAPHVEWVRVFGARGDMQAAVTIAREFGLRVAVGAWIGEDRYHNELEIEGLISLGKRGLVDLAIVGSEVLYREDVSPTELLVYLKRVRQAIPGVPVTTADIYRTLIENAPIVSACDIVLYNSYPYWEGVDIEHAIDRFHARHERVVAIAHGKPVWISETGWPSDGEPELDAKPSLASAVRFFREFRAWAEVHDVPFFWFASFDEAWKAKSKEGEQGAHWGLWDQHAKLKADFFGPPSDGWMRPSDAYLRGEEKLGGEGKPRLEVTSYPALGKRGKIRGKAFHVRPRDARVAVFLFAGGNWWVKPTYDEALTPVRLDGTWGCHVATGKGDEQAAKIAAYLLPASYTPPLVAGHPQLPLEIAANALDGFVIERRAEAPPK